MEFQVGDRVEATAAGQWYDGLTGSVVATDESCGEVGVEFDYGHGGHGHDGPFEDGRDSCWYFWRDETLHELELIEPDYIGDIEQDEEAPKSDQTYRGNGKHTYEHVYASEDTMVDRLRVPGGWLYRTASNAEYHFGDTSYVNVVFVPMPEVVKHKV